MSGFFARMRPQGLKAFHTEILEHLSTPITGPDLLGALEAKSPGRPSMYKFYTALHRLCDRGYITHEAVTEGSRVNTYTRTRAGTDALAKP